MFLVKNGRKSTSVSKFLNESSAVHAESQYQYRTGSFWDLSVLRAKVTGSKIQDQGSKGQGHWI